MCMMDYHSSAIQPLPKQMFQLHDFLFVLLFDLPFVCWSTSRFQNYKLIVYILQNYKTTIIVTIPTVRHLNGFVVYTK